MNKFLQIDLDDLKQKREAIEVEIRQIGQDMSEANNQSSETWHDNAPLDVAQREFEKLLKRREEIDCIIRNAIVVEVDDNAGLQVNIGSEVTFVDNDGRERLVRIGSHTPQEGSGTISYLAPISVLLMEAYVGDIVDGKILGREVEFQVTKIRRWA